MINPTGKPIRIDRAGAGRFGAPRGNRLHYGVDFLCEPGQHVYAPINGWITRALRVYPDTPAWKGLEVKGELFIVKLFYVIPDEDLVEKKVRAGQIIGIAQNITQKYPGEGMLPHIHMETYVDVSKFM